MHRFIATVAFCFGLLGSAPAFAQWLYAENVSVVEITQWDSQAPIYFKLSNGTVCFVPVAEKHMYTLILSLHVAGRRANVHCYATPDSYGGISGGRVHRVISLSQ